MKMLSIEPADVTYLTKVSDEEALEFLHDHAEVIIRVSAREFFGATTEKEYEDLKELRNKGVYSTWEIYID